jgi:ElaB/YqjD/DUF883 family membrane-anchored ribosome-binding protein
MTHPTDADTIEAGIERDRASLASTLGTLQERISVDHLAKEALGMIRSNASAYTSSIDSAVRANPMALTLTGIGIAWLVFGGKKTGADPAPTAIRRWEDEGGTPVNYASRGAVAHGGSADDDWSGEMDSMRDRASATLRNIENDARSYAADLKSGLSDRLEAARDFAAERASILTDFTAKMKEAFASGLDDLSETARDQIIGIRQQAYSARIRMQSSARYGTKDAGRMIEDHPMVAGVIALALGAAFAAALPRTKVEDRTFGVESDRLMDEAKRSLVQERDRAARIAGGVADELKEKARSTFDQASEKVSATADAVKERARSEASS